jgi:hypothetical protein
MTALLALLISLSLFSSRSSVNHPEGSDAINRVSTAEVNFMPTFTDSTFTAQNQTSVNVGWMTIHVDGQADGSINVTGAGTFSTTLLNYPLQCVIHGQSFGVGTPTRIIIDAHTSVRATWTASVVVFDDSETH